MDQADLATIDRFYTAFAARDGRAMSACYAPGATFTDPVFGTLDAADAGAMWRMLTGRAEDLRVEVPDKHAEDGTGSARWIARYTFTQTGRPVVNDVHARFRFADGGLIAEHVDEFSFWRWSRQALGPAGVALGWTPILRRKVGSGARESLSAFRRGEDRQAGPGERGA
jgi:ketosteroid isomerase-like protein